MKLTRNLARTLRKCLGEDWRQKVRDLDFRGADFRDADFSGADFRDADFSGADFYRASFYRADFRGADFSDADFYRASFYRADFRGADFRGADFSGADFRSANFSDYKIIHLISLANACIYPLNVSIDILLKADAKTKEWAQNKTPIARKGDGYEACKSGWEKAFGSEDYVITNNEMHAFWFFCWRASCD